MFKWQRRVLSLLIVMFMFSFGFNCSAVEDYLIYIGCKETNCSNSNCKASLACKDCITNFPAALSLVSAKDEKGNSKVGKYIKDNYCFIPFERNVSENIDVEGIYKNKKNHFCGKCMLEYFVDKFHEKNSRNFDDWKAKYKDNVDANFENLKIGIIYDKFLEMFVTEPKDFPFPVEFVSSREINSYRCKDCGKLFFTSFQSLISQEGYRICSDCEYGMNDHNSRLRIPCITGGSILNRYEEKYIKVKNSKKVEKLGKVVKKPGIKHEEQKK